MRLDGPSLGIGAAVSAAALVAAFMAAGGAAEPALVLGHVADSAYLENGSPVLGDPAAPVTLVEFGDYQCHFCNVFYHETEADILRDYVETGKVRMIFKDYNIIGPDSVLSSHAAHCAGDQGMFWEYHDVLYDHWTGENDGWASQANQEGFARQLGLDVEEWSACVEEERHARTIAASNSDARELELTGTPSFFVIGPDGGVTEIYGAKPYSTFAGLFEAELAG